jgi:hypothetical protein
MNSRRVLFIAACLFPFAAGLIATSPAAAQFQPPLQQPPAASPWDQPPQQSQWPQQPQEACIQEFGKLRDIAQKRAGAIKAAGARKATPKEACGLFNAFSDAELKMIKFASDNTTRCGIPPEVVTTLKQGHARTTEMRTRVCQAAASPMQSAGPSLSDALSAPVPDANNIKTGRGNGTYDTLTGTPLGK